MCLTFLTTEELLGLVKPQVEMVGCDLACFKTVGFKVIRAIHGRTWRHMTLPLGSLMHGRSLHPAWLELIVLKSIKDA